MWKLNNSKNKLIKKKFNNNKRIKNKKTYVLEKYNFFNTYSFIKTM